MAKAKKITPNVSDRLASELVGHTVDLMRFSESVRSRIIESLEKLQADLVGKIFRLESSYVLSDRQKLERLREVFSATERVLRTGYRDLRDQHLDELVPLAKLEARFVPKLFTTALDADQLIQPAFTPAQLKVIAKESLVRGSPSEEWWGRQATSLRQSFEDQIRMGYLQGETVNDLVKRVRGTQVPGKRGEFEGGIMNTSTRNAEALVRTSVHQVANEVQMETYKENEDLIKGLQALATLDLRTTLICRARDHKAWYLDTLEPIPPNTEVWPGHPPWHWGCRTVFVPLTYSWEELAGGDKKAKSIARKVDKATAGGARASMDGQVAKELTQEEWLKSRPVAEQKEVLGQARWELWTKEGLTFEQMVDQRGNPMTIKQLQQKIEADDLPPAPAPARVISLPPAPPPTPTLPPIKDHSALFNVDSLQPGSGETRPAYKRDQVPAWNQTLSNLTASHAEAVEGYRTVEFQKINTAIRTGTTTDPKIAAMVKRLEEVADAMPPLAKDTVVYRGIKEMTPNIANLSVGDTYRAAGMVSTTGSTEIANKFLRYFDINQRRDMTAMMEIVLPKGSNGVIRGFNAREREYLLTNDSMFRVVGVEMRFDERIGKHVKIIRLVYRGK